MNGAAEKRLLLAVLERAILDAADPDRITTDDSSQKHRRTALNWLYDEESQYTPTSFSFTWVCLELDLDPDELRRKLPRLIAEQAGEKKRTQGRDIKGQIHDYFENPTRLVSSIVYHL